MKMQTKEIVVMALMTAVLSVLSPLSIPIGPVPVTLATFAVCLTVTVLGGKRGTISYLVYLLLGLVGLPIFSKFEGGIGKLLGPTGGYLIGMIFLCGIGGFAVSRFAKNMVVEYLFFLLGIALCYLFGTVWLAKVLSFDFQKALSVGVLPFILPDCIKVFLALLLGRRIRAILDRQSTGE